MSNFYITTPIYYVNDVPHIGHAYTTLAADFIARFKRLDGNKVWFLTGTDEHGQKIEKSALAKGMSPQEMVGANSQVFRQLGVNLNISNDDFIRTSEKRHKDYVATIWQKMIANGSIYLGKYNGWYAVRDEAFYDECELVDGKAPTGADVEWLEEPSYFFKLSAFTDKLLAYYEKHPEFIAPESKRNEVLSFVKGGLRDLSVSRTSFAWGIKVPGDEKHVMYVWLDALFNYISALENQDKSEFWPCDLHLVGKDILRFHAVYWPAFLMAVDLPLPKRVFAHGWWTVEGEKMSKSIGNVISVDDLIASYDVDYTRYYLMRELPFGNDGNYSQTLFVQRVNCELANNIGNLMQRVLSFINKFCDGKVPGDQDLVAIDRAMIEKFYHAIDKMRVHIDKQALHMILEELVQLGNTANEYVDKEAPWALKNTDVARMHAVLYTLAECLRCVAIYLQPITPASAIKILGFFGIEKASFADLNSAKALKSGTEIRGLEIVFNRLV